MQAGQIVTVVESMSVTDIQVGLRRVAKEVTSKPEIWVSRMNLGYPTVKEDKPCFEVEYYQLDREDIENREDYLEAARRNTISSEAQGLSVISDGIALLHVQNPLRPVESQENVGQLLQAAIETLNEFSDSHKVVDVVYHDFINDDALHQPFIHIYLKGL